MNDERLGLPSASSLDGDMRCLGRQNLITKHRGEIEEEENDDAKKGTKIHQVLEGELDIELLTDSEKWTVAILMNQEAEMVDKFNMEGATILKEKRMWFVNDKLNPVFSGKVDKVHLAGKKAMIIDYKSGFSYTVPLDKNWQLKSQAVLVAFEHSDVEEFICSLVHPHHPESLREEIIFTREQVEGFKYVILEGIKAGENADADRIPNPVSCKWCPVKKFCEEYKMEMNKQKKIDDPALMNSVERGQRVNWLKFMAKAFEEEEGLYVALLKADPMAVMGWRLGIKSTKKCLDMKEFIKRASKEYGEEKVAELLTLSPSSLVPLEKVKRDVTKKQAEESVEINFKSLFVKTPSDPYLKPTNDDVQKEKHSKKEAMCK